MWRSVLSIIFGYHFCRLCWRIFLCRFIFAFTSIFHWRDKKGTKNINLIPTTQFGSHGCARISKSFFLWKKNKNSNVTFKLMRKKKGTKSNKNRMHTHLQKVWYEKSEKSTSKLIATADDAHISMSIIVSAARVYFAFTKMKKKKIILKWRKYYRNNNIITLNKLSGMICYHFAN